jgi:starch phosphorylase
MAQLTPRFSANRAVREYTENYYLPAAAAYQERIAGRGVLGISMLKWKQQLAQHWDALRFGELHVESSSHNHAFKVEVHLGELQPYAVRVEMYAEPLGGEAPSVSAMTLREGTASSQRWRIYAAEIPAVRAASDYTPRIVPSYNGARVPLEESHILWFR